MADIRFIDLTESAVVGGDYYVPSDSATDGVKKIKPSNFPISTAVQSALNSKANTADLSTVATSGDYNDLSNKPTVPAAGIPPAGTTGQVLAKLSGTDYAVGWTNAGAGDVLAVNNGSDFTDKTAVRTNIDVYSASEVDALAPAITANTMLVDNAAGAARESKTFAQVRSLLEAIPVSDLGALEAWNRGVPGDGTDQTTAMQAIVDSLPAEGGQIIIQGEVVVSDLNLQGRRNIKFLGLGGNGTGAGQRSRLRTNEGAIGAGNRVIDARDSFNISFENLYLYAPDTSFNGTFIDFANISTGSSLMSMDDCLLYVAGASARGLWLYGATQGSFERTTFSGAAYLIQLQNSAGVGFCNVHSFSSCHITPTGTHAPINGSGEGITFQSCNIQASSGDGRGYFWETDLIQPFKGVSIIGCTFYDPTVSSFVWANFYTGRGLSLHGNRVDGVANVTSGGNWAFGIAGGAAGTSGATKGVTGISVLGNNYEFGSAFLSFNGSAANFNNARGGIVGGNNIIGSLTPSGNATLAGGVSTTANILFLPNIINAGTNDIGAHLNYRDIPTSATGLQTGDIWCDTANGSVLKKV